MILITLQNSKEKTKGDTTFSNDVWLDEYHFDSDSKFVLGTKTTKEGKTLKIVVPVAVIETITDFGEQ